MRTKPHLNIGTIGHVDHGKTTLTAAITKGGSNQTLCKFSRCGARQGSRITAKSTALQRKRRVESQSPLRMSNTKLKGGTMRMSIVLDMPTTSKT